MLITVANQNRDHISDPNLTNQILCGVHTNKVISKRLFLIYFSWGGARSRSHPKIVTTLVNVYEKSCCR